MNAETFRVWCEAYKARIRAEKEANKTDMDDKPTGKQLFLMNKQAFEDLTLDEDGTADVDPLDEIEEKKM